MHGDQDSMDIEVIEDTEKAEIEANDVFRTWMYEAVYNHGTVAGKNCHDRNLK